MSFKLAIIAFSYIEYFYTFLRLYILLTTPKLLVLGLYEYIVSLLNYYDVFEGISWNIDFTNVYVRSRLVSILGLI
nr:MAG TPA: hypothetical protein [Bacteriophage sp.]